MIGPLDQVPRHALVWMIVAMFAVVAPHVMRLPIWVIAVYLMCAAWRVMVYRGRWSYPHWAIKLVLTVIAFVGIWLSYGTLIGLEPTVALLLTAFALKLLEVARRKDGYVLLFLAYFVCITEFLFSQDLLITLYSFVCVILVTTALVALHQPGLQQRRRGSLRLATLMLLQAAPLMVVLFFLFPRFGPLWSVPLNSQAAKTGMSDNMRPGDVASLSQSGDVAFRAKFNGEIPPTTDLYWRGLVFSRLRDGAWSGLTYYEVPPEHRREPEVDVVGDVLSYSVIVEPTQQNWLYSLRYARSETPGVMAAPDFRLFMPTIVEAEQMYRVKSWPKTALDPVLSDWRRKIETRLPPKGNERSRQLAREMRASVDSDQAFVDAVLTKFGTENFVYTLQPGTLSKLNGMDEFLFETKRGFCEHYSSAFVVMMRAAGVPARVVAGYQGGEVNPVNKTVIVHQFDAHAWAEVWLPEQGWVRVDPTASVSPERIEWGLERAVEAEGSFLSEAPLSPLRYRRVALLNRLRLEYDALTYRWQSWVVGYNQQEQLDLLHDLLGRFSAAKFAGVLLGSFALVLLPVAAFLFLRRDTRPVRTIDKHYRRFCHRLARAGLERFPGETPMQYAERATSAFPAQAQRIEHITRLYQQLSYALLDTQSPVYQRGEAQLRAAVARCRPGRSSLRDGVGRG